MGFGHEKGRWAHGAIEGGCSVRRCAHQRQRQPFLPTDTSRALSVVRSFSVISGSAHSGEYIGNTYGLEEASNFHWEIYVPMNYDLLELFADCLEGSHRYQGQAQVEEEGYYTARNLTYSIAVSQPARKAAWSFQSGPNGTLHPS